MQTLQKSLILNLLRKFVSQRPGLEYGNYGCPKLYRAELRDLGKQLKDARTLLSALEHSGIEEADLIAELSRGRLTPGSDPRGFARLEFTACEYEPVEYRPAVSRVCASLLWSYVRSQYPHFDGTDIRQHFRRWFGLGVQKRWFN